MFHAQLFNATRGVAGRPAPRPDQEEKERKKEYAREQNRRRYPPSQRAMADARFDYLGSVPPEHRADEGAYFDRHYQQTGQFLEPVRGLYSRDRGMPKPKPAPKPEPPKPEPPKPEPPKEEPKPEPPKPAELVGATKEEVKEAMKPEPKSDEAELKRLLGLGRLTQAQLLSKYDELKVEIQAIREREKLREEARKFRGAMEASKVALTGRGLSGRERGEASIGKYDYEGEKRTKKLWEQAKRAKAKAEEKAEKEKAKAEEKAKAKAEKPKPARKPASPRGLAPQRAKKTEEQKVVVPVVEPEPAPAPVPEKPKRGRPKKELTEEEKAEKRKKEAEKKRAYRAKKKAEMENK